MTEAGVGESLRLRREHFGLGLAQVADILRMDVGILDALEQERFAALGAPVFVRGHLRRYAEFLEMDADEVLRRCERSSPEAASEPDLTHVPHVAPPPDPRRYLWPSVIAACVAVLAGIVWWAMHSPAAPR